MQITIFVVDGVRAYGVNGVDETSEKGVRYFEKCLYKGESRKCPDAEEARDYDGIDDFKNCWTRRELD